MAYALVHGGPAGVTPFAALWLRAEGASMSTLGVLLALPLIGRTLVAAPLAAWATRFAKPWTPVAILCAVVALAALLGLVSHGPWPSILIWWAITFFTGACFPLMDETTVRKPPSGEAPLASARGAGALAYIVANVAVGLLFGRFGTAGVVVWACGTSTLAAIIIPRLMRTSNVTSATSQARTGRSEAVGDADNADPAKARARPAGALALALIAAALIEASHGLNAIAMIGWRARGYGPGLSGVLWATGIVADVAFLWFSGPFRARLGPSRLLIVGGVAAIVRWAGLATEPALPLLFILQALHALSFTATYLAAVELAHGLAPEGRGLSAQAMNWALSTGLCAGLGALGAGPLYLALGLKGYYVMSGVAAAGVLVAWVLEQRLPPRRAD